MQAICRKHFPSGQVSTWCVAEASGQEHINVASVPMEKKKQLLLVFDLLFILLRIVLWPSAGKELSLWLFIVLF